MIVCNNLGAQRCHNVELLISQIKEKGLDPDQFNSYLMAFRHGIL